MSFVQSDVDALFGIEYNGQPQDEPNLEYPDDRQANWNLDDNTVLVVCLYIIRILYYFNIIELVDNLLAFLSLSYVWFIRS